MPAQAFTPALFVAGPFARSDAASEPARPDWARQGRRRCVTRLRDRLRSARRQPAARLPARDRRSRFQLRRPASPLYC